MATERPEDNPTLISLRLTEREIVESGPITLGLAKWWGLLLVADRHDFLAAEAADEPLPTIGAEVMRLKKIRDEAIGGDWEALGEYLAQSALNLIGDPTWFLGMSDEMKANGMESFPDRLREMAHVIRRGQ